MEWTCLGPSDVYDAERLDWLRSAGFWSDEPMWNYVATWADERPGDVFITDESRSLNIGDLREQAERVAGGLSACGLQPGDRVLVQLPNCVETAIVFAALARMGAILVPAQVVLRRHDIESLLERTEAKVMISVSSHNGFDHAEMIRELRPRVPTLRHVVVLGDAPAGMRSFDELVQADPYDGPAPGADDPLIVVFTSGTTSKPKGCVHTSNTYVNHAKAPGSVLGITVDDVIFMPSPLMHNTGMGIGIVLPLVYRIPSVLQVKWEPSKALEIISRHRCTVTAGAPVFASTMLAAYDAALHDLSSFRVMGMGGAPVPKDLVVELDAVIGCRSVAMYGSTEGGMVVATLPEDPPDRTASSDGRAVGGVDLIVADVDGRALPAGEEGEIRFTSPGRFICYWADDERTFSSIDEHGRFRTGDLARMDEDGYLRITGRLSDMIIRGGANISAQEIEDLVRQHPRVEDVALVSMPDERLGERACAFVVASGGPPSLDDLSQVLTDLGVAKYKFPERIEIVDALPRNPTGKVEKFKLRAQIRDILEAEGAGR